MGKILARADLAKALKALSKEKKIVFTNGCFDILHVGHLRYLQEAKSLGDVLIIGVNTDASVRKLKGPERPVQSEGDRAEILAGLACVDFVTLFGEDTPLDLIKALQPDVLVKGGDWKPEQIIGNDVIKAKGGKVLSLKFFPGKSTTEILERVKRL